MKYRYPGAKPFSSEQSNIFFGRIRHIEELFQLTQLETMVTLYSKSGIGKSSLLNAGIIPKYAEVSGVQPVLIRFGSHVPDKQITPIEIAKEYVNALLDKSGFSDRLLPNENSLWASIKNNQYFDHERTGIILIFDQFEELFTYPPDQIEDFKQELAEAIYTKIPQRVLDWLHLKEKGGNSERLRTISEILHKKFSVKVLLAIRSDRLHLVNNISDNLPEILTHCYELDALSQEEAEDAILNPAYQQNEIFISPPFDFEDETIEKILEYLTQGNSQKIESFQLQILCQSLERKIIKQPIRIIQTSDLEKLESIYENYYDDQISLIQSPEDQLAARKLVEEGLIFEEEERRLSLYEGQIHKSFGVNRQLLNLLVDSHLLRAEPSMRGGYTYELSHDTLVGPVLKAKRKRLEAERKRTEEALRLQQELILKAERKKRRRATMAAITGFTLFGTSVVALFLAYQQTRKVEIERNNAQANLRRYQEEKAARDSIMIQEHMETVKTYIESKDTVLAIRELYEALRIDSTNKEVKTAIRIYHNSNP